MAFGRPGRDPERVGIRENVLGPGGLRWRSVALRFCVGRGSVGRAGRVSAALGRAWMRGERDSCAQASSDLGFLARLPVPSGSCPAPRTTWCTSGTCRPRRSCRNYRATQVSALCRPRLGPASTSLRGHLPGRLASKSVQALCVVVPCVCVSRRDERGTGDIHCGLEALVPLGTLTRFLPRGLAPLHSEGLPRWLLCPWRPPSPRLHLVESDCQILQGFFSHALTPSPPAGDTA